VANLNIKEKQMYKVVTHTIREEHFTHPVTVEHALSSPMIGNVCPTGMTIKPTLSAMSARHVQS